MVPAVHEPPPPPPESLIGDRAIARWRRDPQRQLDAAHAQLAVALLIASFPAHWLSPESEDVIRRKLVGRHQRDVLEAIEALALEADKISVRRLMELCSERKVARLEAEAAAAEARKPKPLPVPATWKARVVMEAQIIKAIVRCERAKTGHIVSDEDVEIIVGELRGLDEQALAERAAEWRAREGDLIPGPLSRLVEGESQPVEDPEVWARYYELVEAARKPHPPPPETEAGVRG